MLYGRDTDCWHMIRYMGGPGARYTIMDDSEHARIISMYLAGIDKQTIATAIGCTVSGVYATLIRAGLHVPVRSKVRRNSCRLAAARAGLGG